MSTARRGRELSLGQEALWFLQQLAPGSSAYHVSAALNLHFPVDVAALTAAVRRSVCRHAELTSVCRAFGGEIRGYPGTAPALDVRDVSDMDDRAVRAFAQSLAEQPFQLDQRPPVRIVLLRRDSRPDILFVVAHHIAMDDVSQVLILREILGSYAAEPAGVELEADVDELVRGQRAYLGSARAEAARDYWRAELLPVVDSPGIPTDRPRPAIHRFEGSEIDFRLPEDLVAGATEAAAARNTTPFAYLLSVFQILLYSIGGHPDLIIGYPVTLRSGRRFRSSIGYFVNTLPLCARLDPDDAFADILRRTGRKLWQGLLHREYPFALMPRLVEATRDPRRPGLISTMFVTNNHDRDEPFFQTVLPGRRVDLSGLTVSRFDVPQQQGQFDLTLQVLRHGGVAHAKVKYNTALFTEATARDLAGGYVGLLRSAVAGTLPPRLADIGHSREREAT